MFGKQLLQANHYASDQVQERLESMSDAREDLEKAWIARRMQLDQCLELQLFYRYGRLLLCFRMINQIFTREFYHINITNISTGTANKPKTG